MQKRNSIVIGIDEVGRGALAGPVFVAAVTLPKELRIENRELRIRDSKQLTPKAREAWFRYIKKAKIPYTVRQVSPRVIDRINITKAANLAAERAFQRLTTRPTSRRRSPGGRARYSLLTTNHVVRLDGGLFLGKRGKYPHARTIVKGDERIPAIALASIVAKVLRDRYMVRLARSYPEYGFDVHKGYGTRAHQKALRKHGPSKVHRLTFLKNSPNIR